MAGGELIIDDKFLQSLKTMDDVIQGITDNASDADKSMQKWLSKLNDNSLLNFIEHLSKIASQYRLINETLKDVDGFKDFARKADEANTAIQSLINNIRNTDKFNLEISVEEGLKELKAINDHIEEMIEQEKKLAKEEADTHKHRQQEYDELGRSLKEYGDALVHNFNLTARQYEKEIELARKEKESIERRMEAIRKFIEARREAEQTTMHTSSQRDWEEQQRQQQKADEQYAKQVDARRKERERGIEDAIAFDKREEEAEAKEKEKLEKSLNNYRKYYTELRRLVDEYVQLADTKAQGIDTGVNVDSVVERMRAIESLLPELQAKMDEIASSSPEANERSAAIEKEIYASERLANTKKKIAEATKRQKEEEEAQRKRLGEAANGAMDFANALMEISKAQTKLKLQGETSYDEAMGGYSFLFGGGGAKSLSNLREVQRALEEAKSKQDRFTDSGKKRYKELDDALKKVKETIDEVNDASDETNESHSKLMDTSGQLMRQLALVFSVSQIEGYISKLVSVRKEFELQQKSLQALLQNKQAANEIWNQTIQLAIKSPFRVKELVIYTKELAAYRIETEKLHDTTKMLADVSAGLGVDMSRLILAFGQVRAAEFLRGTELRQFTEAGIPMLEELADHFSALEGRAVSTADVFERISKRMVVFADVEAVFKRLTGESGAFYKMQEKQSETLYGAISNLHDSIDIMLNDIGKSHDGLIKGSVAFARKMVDNWQTIATAIKAAAGGLVLYKLNALLTDKALVRMAVSMNVVTASGTKQLTVMQLLNVGFLRLGKSIGAVGKAMKVFFLSNPWTAIIMAMTAAVVELYSTWNDHKKQLDEINKEYDELIRKVSNIRVEFTFSNDLTKKRQKLQELIDVAEQLNISPNIKMDGITADNIDEIFDNLRKIVIDRQGLITALSTDFEKATHWTISDDLNEDLKEVGGNITKLVPIIEKYKSSVITYIDDLGQLSEERKKMFEPIRKDESELQYYDRLFKAFGEVSKAQKEASTSTTHWFDIMDKAPNVIKEVNNEITKWRTETNHFFDRNEAKKEFDAFVSTILPMLKNIPEEDRSIVIKTWIDTEASKREWDTFTTQYLYGWFEQIPSLNIKFKAELPSEKAIEPWKVRVTEAITKLNEKIQKEQKGWTKDMVLFSLPTDTDTEESFWNKFKEDITKAETPIIEGQKKLSQALVDNINVMKPYADEAKVIANITDKTTKSERDANTILNKRISLIKEIHSAYEKERKLWDEKTSEERVLQSYMVAYEDAFGKNISEYNFKIKEGVSSELLELIPLAEKAGKEAMIALERAIASVEVESGDLDKKLADEKLIRQVEDMFGTYELSLELKDMNIPTDIAEKLFGFESLDLEGLKEALKKLEPQFIGTDQEDKYKDYLQKVAKMEKEAQQKRLKEYVAFARGAIGERAKVKLEEMQKLEDIEKAFVVKDSDSRETKETKNKWRLQAIAKARQEANDAIKKLDWEAFKSSDTFNMVFDDLDRAGQESLNNMIDKLKEFRDQWKDMPFDKMRQVTDLLQKAEEAYYSKSSPFAEARRLRKTIRKDGRTEEQALLDLSTAEQELVTLDNIIAKIQLFQQIKDGLASKDVLSVKDMQLYNQFLSESVGFYNQIVGGLSNEYKLRTTINNLAHSNQLTEEKIIDLLVKQGKLTQGEAAKAKKRITDGNSLKRKYQEQAEAIGNMRQMANDLYDSFYELATNVTEFFGSEISETGKIFAEAGREMMNTVFATLELQKGLKKANEGATGFEKTMNSAMGIVGWIVMAVQIISKIFSVFTQLHDNELQEQIENITDKVEKLDKAYERLQKQMDAAYTIADIQHITAERQKNSEEQIASYERMIELEEQKKDSDADKIKEWRDEIDAEKEAMLEAEREREKAVGGFGNQEDYKEASTAFVEAWMDAYKETGNGLKGLTEKFDEFFADMVQKQLLNKGVESIMAPFYKEWDEKLSDGDISNQEATELKALKEEYMNKLDKFLTVSAEQLGFDTENIGGLGTLQKGIQGITEDQADVLASYLNGIRFFVAEQTEYLKAMADSYNNIDAPNPMLTELRIVADNTTAMRSLFESLLSPHNQGGMGLKVIC